MNFMFFKVTFTPQLLKRGPNLRLLDPRVQQSILKFQKESENKISTDPDKSFEAYCLAYELVI